MLFKTLRFSPHCVEVQALLLASAAAPRLHPLQLLLLNCVTSVVARSQIVSTSATAPQSHQLAMMHTVVQTIVGMKAAHH